MLNSLCCYFSCHSVFFVFMRRRINYLRLSNTRKCASNYTTTNKTFVKGFRTMRIFYYIKKDFLSYPRLYGEIFPCSLPCEYSCVSTVFPCLPQLIHRQKPWFYPIIFLLSPFFWISSLWIYHEYHCIHFVFSHIV